MRWLLLGGLGVLLAMTATAQPPQGRGRGGAELERDGQRPPREHMRRGGAEAGEGERGRQGRRPPPPVMVALDQDRDGVLSASEIDAAATALRTLDRNEDGVVDQRELRPPRGGHGDRVGDGGEGASRRQGAGKRSRRGGNAPVAVEPGDAASDD